MRKVILLLTTLFVTLFFSGCANKVLTYSPKTNNVVKLRDMSIPKTNVGSFTDSGREESKVMCRLSSPIGTPSGQTFASYIQDAFTQELMLANKYDPNSKITISANLDDIYGSTTIGDAYWKFNITIKSSNGTSFKVQSKYVYESSFSAMSACSEMQRSFVPAVQKLNSDIINHPKFQELFKK